MPWRFLVMTSRETLYKLYEELSSANAIVTLLR